MTLSVSIQHRYGDFALDVAFDAPPGVTVLFGRSGSGKTTVVNAVAGLLRPVSGTVSVDGRVLLDTNTAQSLPAHKRQIGYVFQDARLFPHMTVRKNLLYATRFRASETKPRAYDDIVDMLGLSALVDRHPASLSGGETQRVAIGRALLAQPRLLLMDEPLAALDSARKAEILPYLETLWAQTRVPILYVSHAMAEVARLAKTVVVLDAGRVIGSGPAEQVLSDPALVKQVGLREAGTVLPARVDQHHSDGLTELTVSGGQVFVPHMNLDPGQTTRVRILAHDVMISRTAPQDISALNVLPAKVVGLRDGSGPGVTVQLAVGSDRILARITRRSALRLALVPGADVFAVIKTLSIARVDISGG